MNIKEAVACLLAGKVVAIPTETVYGLAANAYDAQAIHKIFLIKNRPINHPLIIHTHSLLHVEKMISHMPEVAYALARAFWPGPLTMILPKSHLIPDIVTGGSSYVGIRIPKHPLTLALLKSIPFPLAAPSANPFGYISPTHPYHVQAQLGKKIDMILDGGSCCIGIESTIVSFQTNTPKLCRLGGITQQEIENLIGPVSLHLNKPSGGSTPGALFSHYAPNKRLILGDLSMLIKQYQHHQTAILAFKKNVVNLPIHNQFILSERGCLKEAAQRLFDGLRTLDQLPVDYILAEWLPNEGMGQAINDRLKRAAYR